MSRSARKGPFCTPSLRRWINGSSMQHAFRTWSRQSAITPGMIGSTVHVHNGKRHVAVRVHVDMVGHKLGEFAPTRTFRCHSREKHSRVRDRTAQP
ncbi:30S ribosomal protein S19 [Candidatus Tremblaya princeps]|uniref:Small ribosomal subunit protein uS19 n=1 Tax=Tremblaya princeps TaxID=189385 RepID=A0A143WNK8_TREPR|nr:30S ribosomal protein S19 [Candidatus Tremblaya princeps]